MKLAYLVVYVFEEKNRPLFDIHLDHIRRHTQADYTIFAAAHKLPPRMRRHVEVQADIEIVDCEVPPQYGVREEHAHCLDRLTAHAMRQGFSHFMTVHLDSFPINEAWLDNLLKSLDEGAVLASLVPNGYSAGLFWSRSYQEQYGPRMLVPDEVRQTARFEEFQAAHPHIDHIETGLGYIYRAWDLGLPWRAIRTDDERKIYEDLFFHLVGATFRTWTAVQPIRNRFAVKLLWRIMKPGMKLLPLERKLAVRRYFIDTNQVSREGTLRSKEDEVRMLIGDPAGYIEELREVYARSQHVSPGAMGQDTERRVSS